MLLRRVTTLALTTLVAAGGTLLTAPGAQAADGVTSLGDLQTSLRSCTGTKDSPLSLTLASDISAPTDGIVANCVVDLDLNGHDLAVHYVWLGDRSDGTVAPGTTLTVDDTSAERDGTLTADGGEYDGTDPSYTAGINTGGATLVIDGGTVRATGQALGWRGDDGVFNASESMPGVGGTWNGAGTTIVNGGKLIAKGAEGGGAGIGGLAGQSWTTGGEHLIVNGGTVIATGGNTAYGEAGPAIGVPDRGRDIGIEPGSTTVNGGSVVATGGFGRAQPDSEFTGGYGGQGIGGITSEGGHDLTVNAGSVTAKGGDGTWNTGGIGIGLPVSYYRNGSTTSGGDIIINGGTVTASGGAFRSPEYVYDGVTYPAENQPGLAMGAHYWHYIHRTVTVGGTLRLPDGKADLTDYTQAGDGFTVTGTGRILGSVDDPTVGATLQGNRGIRNDGVIALSTDRVKVGVTGQNHLVSFADRNESTPSVRVFAKSFDDGHRELPKPTRASYDFLGWNTKADGSGETITATSTLPGGDPTLHAQWDTSEIVVAKPTISGSPVVGGTLTATPGTVTPAGTTSAYVWRSGDTELGTGTTYEVKPADLGKTITVTQTGSKDGYEPTSATSAPTAEVAKAAFTSTGGVTVTGTAKVGSELTATSTVEATPTAATTSGQWFRGNDAIADATDKTYTLRTGDIGSTVTYVETRQRDGYADLVISSDPTAKVMGVITLGKPTVTGDAVVDQTLTATSGEVTPTGTTSTYAWKSGASLLGTGSTYEVKPGDVGTAITLVQTATKDDHDTATAESAATAEVSKAAFTSTGTVKVTGTARVGQELTATSTVETTPAATSTAGQWFRGDDEIADATDTTYTLGSDDLGATIRYVETRERVGYTDLVTRSEATARVSGATITLGKPTITGDAVVDQTLTVTPGETTPAGTTSTYVWKSGNADLGTGGTYEVEAADLGKTITVVQTATKDDHDDVTAESTATAEVTKASFASTGKVTVSGTPKVGQALTATSTVETTPAATSTTGQWFRGSDKITGATERTYTVTNADASAQLTYVETRTRAGYTDLVTASEATSTVTGGVITVGKPVITGDAVVDQTLTVTPGAVEPAGTGVTYVWRDGDTELGTGPTYTVKPADVDKSITVTQTAARTDHDSTSATSAATSKVARATFVTAPTASFTGVLKVGQTLTAAEGAPAPTPDSYSYQWFAGDKAITGATSRTFTLTSAQKGATVAVKVTAIRTGYVNSSSTSEGSVAPVATDQAPTLDLSASKTSLRLGQSATLTWSSADATTVTASGSWSGTKTATGTESVTPDAIGTSTYTLVATNDNGTTTAQVAVEVSQSAATFTVKAPAESVSGRLIDVTGSGLDPQEAYTVKFAGIEVATGKADANGKVAVTVRVPTAATKGTHTVRIYGELPDRRGTTNTRMVKTNIPKIVLAKHSVKKGKKQKVTLSGLEAGEKVVVTYRGKRISGATAKASSKGVYSRTFSVGSSTGTKTVKVTTTYSPKTVAKTFRVVR